MLLRPLFLLCLPFGLAGCAALESLMNPLTPSDGASAAFVLSGQGVQLFQCTSDAAGRYWRFIAPDTRLTDAQGRLVARQGSDGSFFAEDNSALSAKIVRYAQDSPAEDLRDLLYQTSPRGKQGVLSDIVYVKRSNGKGGVPLTRCSPSQLGSTLKVPFTATYTFYRQKP